jgi:hypothetical protein
MKRAACTAFAERELPEGEKSTADVVFPRSRAARPLGRIRHTVADECERQRATGAMWSKSWARCSLVRCLEPRIDRRTVLSWDAHSVSNITDVLGLLLNESGSPWHSFTYLAFGASGHFVLSSVPSESSDPALASALAPVREVLSALIQGDATNADALGIPVHVLQDMIGGFNEVCQRLASPSPHWNNLDQARDLLEQLPYDPRVESQDQETAVEVFRKVLDLPLWKYRWYVYEVWSAFRLLHVLKDFSPVLRVSAEGQLSLVRGSSTTLATFQDERGCAYALAAQRSTPVDYPGREAICPDYRIDRESEATTLVLVECKQRALLVGQALATNMVVYEAGCPDTVLNVFVNYDAPGHAEAPPPRTRLIELFRPGEPERLSEFERLISAALHDADVRPPRPVVVLFDDSGSMKNVYADETHAAFWEWYEARGFPPAHRFTGLLDEMRLSKEDLRAGWSFRRCDGSTDLPHAVHQAVAKYGANIRVLAVTDVADTLSGLAAETIRWNPSAGSPNDLWRASARANAPAPGHPG